MAHHDGLMLDLIREAAQTADDSHLVDTVRTAHNNDFVALETQLEAYKPIDYEPGAQFTKYDLDQANGLIHETVPDLPVTSNVVTTRRTRRQLGHDRQAQRFNGALDQFVVDLAKHVVFFGNPDVDAVTTAVDKFAVIAHHHPLVDRALLRAALITSVTEQAKKLAELGRGQSEMAATLKSEAQARGSQGLRELTQIFLVPRPDHPSAVDVLLVQSELDSRARGERGILTEALQSIADAPDHEHAHDFINSVARDPRQFASAHAVIKFVLLTHGIRLDLASSVEEYPEVIEKIVREVEHWPPQTRSELQRYRSKLVQQITEIFENKTNALRRFVDVVPSSTEVQHLWENVNRTSPGGRLDRRPQPGVQGHKAKTRATHPDDTVTFVVAGTANENGKTEVEDTVETGATDFPAVYGYCLKNGQPLYGENMVDEVIDRYCSKYQGTPGLAEDIRAVLQQLPVNMAGGSLSSTRGIKISHRLCDINGKTYDILSVKPNDVTGVPVHSKLARDSRLLVSIVGDEQCPAGRVVVIEVHHKDRQQSVLNKYARKGN